MALDEVERRSSAEWERPLAGSLDELTVRSQLLEGNPLGDPAVRPLYVYQPPTPGGEVERLPSIYVLQGFGGRLEEWLSPTPSGATTIEQLDAMCSAGQSLPAVVVFVDASTSWGGSQFLNSTSTGRYLEYLCDEVVTFVDARYPTLSARERRGICGKSSGGYGALAISMLRPEMFGALASHAGDALFECCYQPLFPIAARLLRDQFGGSWEAFEARAHEADFDWRECAPLFAAYGTACAYTPDPDRPGKALMPFDDVGRPIEEVWSCWLALDPVRMAAGHAEGLRSMRSIHLDAGLQDEFFLDLGARALSNELARLGIPHSLKLFEGTHDGVDERIPAEICKLARALHGPATVKTSANQ